jgi:predicted ATPase/class 3 adenylate cyclase
LDERAASGTFLFTDIEGSTRLWDEDPERMRPAMARHDALLRKAVLEHRGEVVKMTGDGVHAIFGDPLEALEAAVDVQRGLTELERSTGLKLRARCGVHAGTFERRDNDYYGNAVNRAARIMAAGHGGQILISATVVEAIGSGMAPGLAFRDLGRVRLRDLARGEQLFQVIHPGLRTEFPVLRSLEKTPNNLPVTFSSFVGRKREVAEVRELLGRSRLLTLTGMGGLGKTRLALQVAAEAMDAYPDGVWQVELAPLNDGRRVAQAAASAMNVHEEAGHTVLEALRRHVRDRELLLVLDNCEHLLEATAVLARDLLAAGPGVRILATSREALHVNGEATYGIDGLAVPDPDAAEDPDTAATYDAVRLFVDRASAALPSFALTDRTLPAVGAICARLDGIPLAIELAAARVRALPVDEIAARMDDRFRLVTTTNSAVPERQRTLRALIDWSHELLPDDERGLFHRLSIFAGGWTLEAAEAVCADLPSAHADVVDLLARLVEKSLVTLDEDMGRYGLLETVRQYAQEKLETSAVDAARARHRDYFLGLAEQARQALIGPEQGAWLERLDYERENVLAALAWMRGRPDAGEAALQLVSATRNYWINRGLLELGLGAMEEALAHPGARSRGAWRMRTLFHAGQMLCVMGRYTEARTRLEESLAIARERGEPLAISWVLQPLGMAATGQGELAVARRYLDEALLLAQASGDKREVAAALNALAQLDRLEGHPEKTEVLYRETVRLLREVGDHESAAIGLLNLAMACIAQGNGKAACAMILEALATAEQMQSRPVTQSVLEVSAGLAVLQRDWKRAARFFGAAEAYAGETGVRRDPADESFLAPRMELARSALGASVFHDVETQGRGVDSAQVLRETRAWLASPEILTPATLSSR